MSSNVVNTAFYNSHGFVTVGAYTVGDHDPDWKEPAVLVNIVCTMDLFEVPTRLTFVHFIDGSGACLITVEDVRRAWLEKI